MQEAESSQGEQEETTGVADEKSEMTEGKKAGIWARFRLGKKKRAVDAAEGTSSSPTIKAGHHKGEEEGSNEGIHSMDLSSYSKTHQSIAPLNVFIQFSSLSPLYLFP